MKFLFPTLIALATAATVVAFARETPSEQESVKKLNVAAAAAPELTPWLLAAARDLGHTRVRAYDGSVFIDVGDDSISFFKEKNALQMHVALETQYRMRRAEREPAIHALSLKGQTIFDHAVSLRARAEAKQQVAQSGTTTNGT